MLSSRSIHGLASVTAHPGRQVMVVPGIDTADAAAILLTGKPLAIVTWPNGGPDTCDWQPLAGRRVILWPEGPAVGGESLDALAGILADLGCAVRVIDGDIGLAEAIQDGWTAAAVIEYAKARARDWTGPQEREVMPDISKYNNSTETRPHSPSPPVGGGAAQFGGNSAAAKKISNEINVIQASNRRESRGNVEAIHGATIPLSDDLDDYRSHFITDENGKIKPRLSNNYLWMLRGHPETRGLFAWNETASAVFVMARPPWESGSGPWTARALWESDTFHAMTWLERQGLTLRKNESRDTIRNVALYTRYNPVVDYLTGLRWDGCPRLQGGVWESDTVPPLSTEYLGAPDDPIFGIFLTKWHIAAVVRAFRPGIKADCMVIFESPQGRFKSTYLRTMATIDGHEYFTDGIGDIGNPSSIMLLQGCWIVEVAELAGLSRKETDIVKAWLSRTTDRYVPKYEGEPREVPRNYIVAGTHNPSGHGYLKDPTGARRFWPVPITRVDLPRVERDRDQIWAEAVHLYHAGVKWWLTADEERQADALTADRKIDDPWASKIDDAVKGMPTVTLAAVITALQVPIAQQSELTAKRISEHLKAAGFERGKDQAWRRVGEPEQQEML